MIVPFEMSGAIRSDPPFWGVRGHWMWYLLFGASEIIGQMCNSFGRASEIIRDDPSFLGRQR